MWIVIALGGTRRCAARTMTTEVQRRNIMVAARRSPLATEHSVVVHGTGQVGLPSCRPRRTRRRALSVDVPTRAP